MTKLIAIIIIALVLFGGWRLFLYWEKIENEKVEEQKQAASARVMGDSLPGMPSQLDASFRNAQQQGAPGIKAWLKTYGSRVEDPRKAWIELEYCVMIAREDPAEARRIFAEVKQRTPPSSPLIPRIKELAKTYE